MVAAASAMPVTIERIDGAIHDVFLSAPAARTAAYAALEAWLLTGAVPRAIPAELLEYYLSFVFGGILAAYRRWIASDGGVPIESVSAPNLCVSNAADAPLYICGEALDIDADCGGFNLAWAWVSGIRAASSL